MLHHNVDWDFQLPYFLPHYPHPSLPYSHIQEFSYPHLYTRTHPCSGRSGTDSTPASKRGCCSPRLIVPWHYGCSPACCSVWEMGIPD